MGLGKTSMFQVGELLVVGYQHTKFRLVESLSQYAGVPAHSGDDGFADGIGKGKAAFA